MLAFSRIASKTNRLLQWRSNIENRRCLTAVKTREQQACIKIRQLCAYLLMIGFPGSLTSAKILRHAHHHHLLGVVHGKGDLFGLFLRIKQQNSFNYFACGFVCVCFASVPRETSLLTSLGGMTEGFSKAMTVPSDVFQCSL